MRNERMRPSFHGLLALVAFYCGRKGEGEPYIAAIGPVLMVQLHIALHIDVALGVLSNKK